MNHHKSTQKFGICLTCEEPSASLSPTGHCPECEEARINAILYKNAADFDEIDGKRISAAKHNNANADVLSKMFAYFI
jgi:hypothetical protein